MVYGLYPAVDNATYQFSPLIRAALAESPELHHLVIPMTEIDRNDLMGTELWNGRLVFNTTSNKINYYNSQTALWYEIDLDKLSLYGGSLLGPLTLSGDPSLADHAANKNYVDTYRAYPGRNRIINGDFSVNQRAVVSASALGQFMADRWYVVMSNVSCSASMVQATIGELPESAVQYLRLISGAQSAAGDYANFRQSIESVRTFSGKTVTISFWAKSATGTPKVAIDFEQHFGTGGSPSSNVSTPGGLVTIDSTWKRYSVTVAIPAITGKTFGTSGTDQLIARFWISAGSTYNTSASSIGLQNATVNFWGVQVEEGPVASPFEQKTYAEELRACQRYYELYAVPVNGGNDLLAMCYNAASPAVGPWKYIEPKRIPPAISFPVNGGARYISTAGTPSGLTMTTSVNKSIYSAVLATSTNQAVGAGWFDGFTVVADAEL